MTLASQDPDGGFSIDLSGLQDDGEEEISPAAYAMAEDAVYDLLEPYSSDVTDKARQLLIDNKIELAKRAHGTDWFNVQGSRLYVTKVFRDETSGELFAECSCPNGQARGGESGCYHSVAARVIYSGVAEVWVEGFKLRIAPGAEDGFFAQKVEVDAIVAEANRRLTSVEVISVAAAMITPLSFSISEEKAEPKHVAPVEPDQPKATSIMVRTLDGPFTKQRVSMFTNGDLVVENWLEVHDPDTGKTAKGWSNKVRLTLDEWDWELPE